MDKFTWALSIAVAILVISLFCAMFYMEGQADANTERCRALHGVYVKGDSGHACISESAVIFK